MFQHLLEVEQPTQQLQPFLTPREFAAYVSGLDGCVILVSGTDGRVYGGRVLPMVDGQLRLRVIGRSIIGLNSSAVADIHLDRHEREQLAARRRTPGAVAKTAAS